MQRCRLEFGQGISQSLQFYAADQWQYSWVRWELPSEVSSILAEAWFSECRGLLREVGQAQSFGHCSPVRGSNSRQTARRARTPRLLTTNDQNIPIRYRCAVPGNRGSARGCTDNKYGKLVRKMWPVAIVLMAGSCCHPITT